MNARHLLLILGATATLGITACDRSSPAHAETAPPAALGPDVAQLEQVTLEVLGMT